MIKFSEYYINELSMRAPIHKDILYVHDYLTRDDPEYNDEYKKIRDTSYAIKDKNNMDDIKLAAKEMASLVSPGNVLVPIPNSKGDTSANLVLANEISKLTSSEVEDVLGIKAPKQSNRELAISGKDRLHPTKLGLVLTDKIKNANDVLFIDNVLTSGSTIRGAINLINGGNGLVYSKVKHKGQY